MLLQPESAVALVPAAQARPLNPRRCKLNSNRIPQLQAQKKSEIRFFHVAEAAKSGGKFGVSAIFLFLGGTVLFLVMPDARFSDLWGGQKHFLAMGFLW